MTIQELQQSLIEVIENAKKHQLDIRHHAPGDLVVIGCQPQTKQQLGDVVALATRLNLRAKWCNDGTLVAIGIPTQKNGKKGNQQTSEGSS
jgi:hypothetical protein